MAYLYRLFVLCIALFLSLPILAAPNDNEPGKAVPPKVRVDRPILPDVPAIAGMPIKLPVISPLPWSRLINPAGPDPIRFTMRASKDSIAIGEEFEITITAELLNIAPQSMFFFEEQKSFSLKVLMPQGFQQTGGDYHDNIEADFSKSEVKQSTYTIKGRFTEATESLAFTLLRGPKGGDDSKLYQRKSLIKIYLKRAKDQFARSAASCDLQESDVKILPSGIHNDSLAFSIDLIGKSSSDYEYSTDGTTYKNSRIILFKNTQGPVYVRSRIDHDCSILVDTGTKTGPKPRGIASQASVCGPVSISANLSTIYTNRSGAVIANSTANYFHWFKKINGFWTEITLTRTTPGGAYVLLDEWRAGVYRASDDCGNTSNEVEITELVITPLMDCNTTASQNKVTVNIVGGAAPYSSILSKDEFPYTQYGPQQSPLFTNVASGIYTVMTYDAESERFYQLYGEKPYSSANINLNPLSLGIASRIRNCQTGKTLITLVGSNGKLPYQFSADGGITYQSSNIFNLSAGSYTFILKDAFGCTTTSTYSIEESPAIKIKQGGSRPACGTYPTGGANVVAYGGSGTLQYSIDGGSHFQTSPNFEKLAGGQTYTILTKDGVGCQVGYNVFVDKVSQPVVSITKQDAVCYETPGSITIQAQGGSPDSGPGYWSYSINGTSFKESGSFTAKAGSYTVTAKNYYCNIPSTVVVKGPTAPISTTFTTLPSSCSQPTGSITNISTTGGTRPYRYSLNALVMRPATSFIFLKAGRYTLYVRDSAGCSAQFPASIATDIGSFTVNTTVVDVPCFDDGEFSALGSVILNPSGGLPPYSYATAGGSFTSVNSYSLTAGTYNFTVRDANRCLLNVDATIRQPDAVTATAVVSPILCRGGAGTVQVTVGGGTAPYEIKVNGSSIGSATSFTAVAGNYNVQVIDAHGCVGLAQVVLTQPASMLGASAIAGIINCYGESANLSITASGGVAPYQYSVDNGSQFSIDNLFSVGAGTYTVRVRDANGCEVALVPRTITAPAALSLTTTATNVVCQATNGSITATGSGGTAPYQYFLNNTSTQATGSFSNLKAGQYLVNVLDAKGCNVSKPVIVGLSGSTLTVSSQIQHTTCGLSNGSITVTPQGGQAPYSYRWTGGQTTPTLSNLAAGIYMLTVTDANGCRYDVTAQLNSSQPLPIIASSSSPATVNSTLNLSTQVYDGASYEWRGPNGYVSTQAQSYINQVTLAAAGSYTLTVTKDGCASTTTTQVEIVNCQLDFVAGVNAVVWQCTGNQTTVTVAVQGQTTGKQLQVKVDDNDWMAGPTVSIPNLGIGQHIVSIRERPAGLVNNSQDCPGGSRTFSTFCTPSTVCYTITPKHSNKPLLADYTTTTNGASVRQMAYQQLDGQIWRFTNTTDGYLKIVSADINNVIESEGATVRMWADRTGYNQDWRLTRNSEGAYRIMPRTDTNAGLTIPGGSYTNGTSAVVTAYNATDNQLFWVQPTTCPVSGNTVCNAVGTITYERWNNIPGLVVSDLLTNPKFGQAADAAQLLTSFEAPANIGDQYGARIRGTVCAPVNGDYTFWISSDDGGELYVSTDNSPLNKQRIAFTNNASGSRQYENNANQKSALVTLQKGVTYYIEAYVKEGGGEDYLSVSWQLPNRPWDRLPIGGQYLSPVDACAFTVTADPNQVSLPAGQKTQFTANLPAGITNSGGFVWEHSTFRHVFSSATSSDSVRQLEGNPVWVAPQAAGQFTYKVSQKNNPSCYREIQVTATPAPVSCICQDCEAAEWQSETISVNPANSGTDYTNMVENTYLAQTQVIGGTTEIRQQITYLDGFGRPMQVAQTGASPTGKDIVLPIEYDGFGRTTKSYLPYTAAAGGAYKSDAIAAQSSFYTSLKGDGMAYAVTLLEQSPLQRVKQQGSIGAAWQPNASDANKTGVVKAGYRHNTETTIPQLSVAYNGNNWILSRYAANQLYVNETKDATNNKVEEFTDLFGQTVCKKVYNGTDVLTTYYVYDDFGRLRYTFPPKAAQKLESQANGSVDFTTTATVKDQIYWYVYDARGRVVEKKTPDATLEEMVYNPYDQVVLYRNGMHRAKGQWLYSKYDEVGRMVSKGVYASANSRSAEQAAVANSFSSASLFNDAAYPTSGITELSRNYYDDYAFTGKKAPDQPTEFGLGTLASEGGAITLVGKLTGTKETILKASGAAATTKTSLLTTYYYDQYGRIVQTRQENHLGGEDLSSARLDFAGRLTETKLTTIAFSKTTSVWTRNTYDRGNRLKMTCQRINDGQKEPIARFVYNDLGEVTEKWQGCKQQVISYQTDIRGRLTSINSSDPVQLKANKQFFGLKLEYGIDDNVSAQEWGSVPHLRTGATLPAKRRYAYTYDPIGRIKGASYTGGTNENFSVSGINYDLNGNILSMARRVQTPSLGDSPTEDNLSYAYAPNSNQLRNVSDSGVATPTSPKKAHYFNDRNQVSDDGTRAGFSASDDYAYDEAGNLIRDKNRDIQSIAYNVLGLPEAITFGNQTKIYYVYTGGGDKLQKQGAYLPTDQVGQYSQKQIDYTAGVVYTDQVISFIPTAEGRALPPVTGATSPEYGYEYQQTDHLGNLRSACRCGVKFDQTGKLVPVTGDEDPRTVVQETHYDPWGLNLADIETTTGSGLDWWQFTGQEQDYQAYTEFAYRQYDRTLGRFTSVDPMADAFSSISPFNYADNSPIANVDLYGLQAVQAIGSATAKEAASLGIRISGSFEWAVSALSTRTAARTVAGAIPSLAINMAVSTYLTDFGQSLSGLKQQLSSWQGAGNLLRRSIEAPIQGVFDGYNGGWNQSIRSGIDYVGDIPNRPVGQTIYDGTYTATDIAVKYAIAKGVGAVASKSTSLKFAAEGNFQRNGFNFGIGTRNTTPDGSFYSVAYEMKLSEDIYPGKRRRAHFTAANEALNEAVNSDPAFASQMQSLGIDVPRTSTGKIDRISPRNWVWHHHTEPGVMQLVPKGQHPDIPGGIFWNTMHPGGKGGFSIWGK